MAYSRSNSAQKGFEYVVIALILLAIAFPSVLVTLLFVSIGSVALYYIGKELFKNSVDVDEGGHM